MEQGMTNSELEVALDLELDKSSLLCNKLRGAFEGLSRTLSLKSEFEQDEDEAAESVMAEPLLFSVFLQQHGIGETGDEGAESKHGSTADSQAASLQRLAASPHPFDKTRHGHGHALHGSATPPREMGPAVASATGTLSTSKLLERLKRTQGLATPG